MNKAQRELIEYLFDSRSNLIAARLGEWIETSSRYQAFIDEHRDKVRKKVRVAADSDALLDLLFELRVPYLLLKDSRFEVRYEPYAAGKTKGPDFAVTFRTNFTFNAESTHVRGLNEAQDEVDQRFVDVVSGKLRQMLPNIANVIFIATPHILDETNLASHMVWMRGKADNNDEKFLLRQRFSSPADFFKFHNRVSAIYVYDSAGEAGHAVWFNPQAKATLPDPLKAAIQRGFEPAGR